MKISIAVNANEHGIGNDENSNDDTDTDTTPSPPTKSLGFEGFDSSTLLILRGGNSHVRMLL